MKKIEIIYQKISDHFSWLVVCGNLWYELYPVNHLFAMSDELMTTHSLILSYDDFNLRILETQYKES